MLVGGAELVDRRRRDPGVRAEPGADPARGAGRGELLGPDGVVDAVAALAAELDRVLEPEEAELAGAVVELARELARPPPTRRRCGTISSRTQRPIVSRSWACSSVNGGSSARSPAVLDHAHACGGQPTLGGVAAGTSTPLAC